MEEGSIRNWILDAAKAFVVHPLGHFLLFIVFLYQVKECYPFTHIPMYSDPESRAPYYILTDADGNALGVKSHGGITPPKMRKMYKKRLEIYCKKNGFDKNAPPQSAIDTVAGKVMAFMREEAIGRGNPFPDTLRFVHVLIEPAPAPEGFKETSTLVYENTLSPAANP